MLAWLQEQTCFPKLLWKGRAAAGIAASFSKLPPLTDQRLFGWRHFTPSDAPEWRAFPSEFYFLPRYECSEGNGLLQMTTNNCSPAGCSPDFCTWTRWIEERPVEKVVLARRLSFTSSLDPLQWAALTQPTFFIQMDPHTAFFGKPPEHLYRRQGRYIESDAVAGTQLIDQPHTEKDRLELSYIESALREALTPLVSDLRFSPITTRTAGTIHHLCRVCSGTLHEEVTDTDLLQALHPTPAVGGWPNAEALSYISRCETFQRGLYAAPIGWISADAAEWLVAIRSALIDGPTLHLYSGAGIVNRSQPAAEWQELDRKVGWITSLF